MKLNEKQLQIIDAYTKELQAKQRAAQEANVRLSHLLFGIAGREFQRYEIKEGELIILDKPEFKDQVKALTKGKKYRKTDLK
jgi:hypothetical protein